jgi:serine/threonine protein kinase
VAKRPDEPNPPSADEQAGEGTPIPAAEVPSDAHADTSAPETPPAAEANGESAAPSVEPDAATPAASAPAPARTAKDPAQVAFGDFRILSKLGAGGCGVVYKAHQISRDRVVALKVLFKEMAAKPAFVERFQREARAMAKLDHPNIIRAFEVGQKQGTHYIVAEYVDGGSVRDWFDKLGKFSIGDALHIVLVCAHALQHAHDQKFVHRDVKPDNVLLTRAGVVKLADLGLAKAWEEDMSVTMTGAGIGTPLYMAPEQARNAKNLDGRTDIYALGVMLYHLLVGAAPFAGETVLELIEAKERGTYRPARKTNSEIPPRLDLIMAKMMARRSEDRYSSCTDVILALDELELANEQLSFIGSSSGSAAPTLPPPPSVPVLSSTARPTETFSYWYLQHTAADGRPSVLRMSTSEILGLIKADKIEADAQISRDREGPFGALASYREFESVLQSKTMKAKGGLKSRAARLHRVYEMAEKKAQGKRLVDWLPKFGVALPDWAVLTIWSTIAAAVAIGLLALVSWGFD